MHHNFVRKQENLCNFIDSAPKIWYNKGAKLQLAHSLATDIKDIYNGNAVLYRYAYDSLGQLIREDNAPLNKSYTYEYDAAGNRTMVKEYAYTTGALGNPTYTNPFTYSSSAWGDQLQSFDTYFQVNYDTIGNPTSYNIYGVNECYELTWQGRELKQFSYSVTYDMPSPDTLVEFTYNADGVRTSKTYNGIKHEYTLNGSQVLADRWTENGVEYLMIFFYDETGAPSGFKFRTSSYANDEFDYYFYEKNLFGDIIAIYDETGYCIGGYTYDAWGNFYTSGGISPIVQRYNPFRYRGYFYDYETGLYYLQSRYYNPQWGRFINADGYVSTGQGILGNNMYLYCGNDPINRIDPTGDSWLLLLLVIVVAPVVLTGCSNQSSVVDSFDDGTQDPNSLDGTPLDPAPDTTPYDTPEEAIDAAIDYVFNKSNEIYWTKEVGVSVYQYLPNGKYYIGMNGNKGVGNELQVTIPIPSGNSIQYAIIHSHPQYQREPFKQEDWNTYWKTYNRQVRSYIVEIYEGARLVRYLDVNTYRQDDWKVYP